MKSWLISTGVRISSWWEDLARTVDGAGRGTREVTAFWTIQAAKVSIRL